jgi:hypothetical protein
MERVGVDSSTSVVIEDGQVQGTAAPQGIPAAAAETATAEDCDY